MPTRGSTSLIAALLVACTAPKPSPEESAARWRRIRQIEAVRTVDADFAARGRALANGFPDRIEDDSFLPGDRLVFGVESFHGPEVERFYLVLETVEGSDGERDRLRIDRRGDDGEPQHTRFVATEHAVVEATLLDPDLQELARDRTRVDCTVHELGLFPFARGALGPRAKDVDTIDSPRVHRPMFMLDPDWGRPLAMHTVDTLLTNDAMVDLAERLAIMPAWFEAIGMIGAQLRIYFGISHPRIVDQPIPELPVGQKALQCRTSIYREHPYVIVNVVLVPSVGPLAMSAGIVTLTGYLAEEPDRRFVVRLLGMERGRPSG